MIALLGNKNFKSSAGSYNSVYVNSRRRLSKSGHLTSGLVSVIDDLTGIDLFSNKPKVGISGTSLRTDPALKLTRGYGPTYGSGTGDYLQSSFTKHATLRTYACWVTQNSVGGGSSGRIFDKMSSSITNQVELMLVGSAGYYSFGRTFSTTQGAWEMPVSTTNNIWYLIAFSYDSSSTSNDPIGYINGRSQTINEFSTPSGTLVDNAAEYMIGNRGSGATRYWDGLIGPLFIWNRILSPSEHWAFYTYSRWALFEYSTPKIYNNIITPATTNLYAFLFGSGHGGGSSISING